MLEQPSPSIVLPSSHSSFVSITPFPHKDSHCPTISSQTDPASQPPTSAEQSVSIPQIV